jgi:hypothetical protein
VIDEPRAREHHALAELRAIGISADYRDGEACVSTDTYTERIFTAAREYARDRWNETRGCLAQDMFETMVALYCRTGFATCRKERFHWPHDPRLIIRFAEMLRPYGYDVSIVNGGVQLDAVYDERGHHMHILPPTPIDLHDPPPPGTDYNWYW